jgi:hypothetical protein
MYGSQEELNPTSGSQTEKRKYIIRRSEERVVEYINLDESNTVKLRTDKPKLIMKK